LKKQQIATTLNLPDRINALDIDPAKHLAVLTVGSGIASTGESPVATWLVVVFRSLDSTL